MGRASPRLGVIGVGHVGRMYAEHWLSAGQVEPGRLMLSHRNVHHVAAIRDRWTEVLVSDDVQEIFEHSDTVVLAVRPNEVAGLLGPMRGRCAHAHVISLVGFITVEQFRTLSLERVSRALPSVASVAGHGVTLVHHGENVCEERRRFCESLFESAGRVKVLEKGSFAPLGSVTGSGPAVIAALLDGFLQSVMRTQPEDLPEAREVLLYTLVGMLRTLEQTGWSFDELIRWVATPGGVSEAAVEVIRRTFPDVALQLKEITAARMSSLYKDAATQLREATRD